MKHILHGFTINRRKVLGHDGQHAHRADVRHPGMGAVDVLALQAARLILSRIVEANHGKPLKTVHFFVKYPAVDRLGHSFDALGMEVTYNMASFQDAQWGNMTFFDLAELPSEISFRKIGAEAAIEYCNEGDNVKYTPTFCSKVLAFALR